MAEIWEPSQGETVQVVDRDSNDYGKFGKVSIIRRNFIRDCEEYGVTFGDNVLRYFSRYGLTWVDSPAAQPATDPLPAVLPRKPLVVWLDGVETGDVLGTMHVRGNVEDLFALAAELVKRG